MNICKADRPSYRIHFMLLGTSVSLPCSCDVITEKVFKNKDVGTAWLHVGGWFFKNLCVFICV